MNKYQLFICSCIEKARAAKARDTKSRELAEKKKSNRAVRYARYLEQKVGGSLKQYTKQRSANRV